MVFACFPSLRKLQMTIQEEMNDSMVDGTSVILPPKLSLAINEGHYAVALIMLYKGMQFLAKRVEDLERQNKI